MTVNGPYTVLITLHPNPNQHTAEDWTEYNLCGDKVTFDSVGDAIRVASSCIDDGNSAIIQGRAWDEDCGWDAVNVWTGIRRFGGEPEIDDLTDHYGC